MIFQINVGCTNLAKGKFQAIRLGSQDQWTLHPLFKIFLWFKNDIGVIECKQENALLNNTSKGSRTHLFTTKESS